MIQELECCRVLSVKCAELRWRLEVAPWLWPDPSDLARTQWASSKTGRGAPRLAVGRALAISVGDHGGSAWLLADDGDLSGPSPVPSWGRLAQRAWKRAVLAVSRGLPVIGIGLRDLVVDIPHAHYLGSAPKAHHSGRIEHSLDGESYGLAFALYLVSRLTGEALPGDVVALASVDADGNVGPVGALREKIEAVRRLAPSVRRILVSDLQETGGDVSPDDGLVIAGVNSLEEAVARLFDRDPTERMILSAAGPQRRAALIEVFFRTVITGRRALVHWMPIHRAAGLALAAWDGLDDDARYRLEYVHAVAGRHEQGQGTLSLPPAGWLASHPRPLQARILAGLLQHSADTCTPDPASVERLASEFAAGAGDCYAPQLAVRGALARLYAVTGRPAEALRMQEETAQAFVEAFDDENVSHSLAEWYRLAGACRDRESFDRAESCRTTVIARGGLDVTGTPYVVLSRCRASILLGLASGKGIETDLERMQADEDLPEHVRWSATRWRIRRLAQLDTEAASRLVEKATATIGGLEAAEAQGEAHGTVRARVFHTLILMDQEIAAGRQTEAGLLLDTLLQLRGGPVRHLVQACPGEQSPAEYVARFYPY